MERTGALGRHRRASSSARRRARSRSASATAAATPTPARAGSGFALLRQLCSRLDVAPSATRGRAGSCASRRRCRPDAARVIARRPRDGARAGCVARSSSWRCDSSSAPISSFRPGETRISSSSFRLSAFASRLDVCWTAHTMIRVTSETTRAVVDSSGPSCVPTTRDHPQDGQVADDDRHERDLVAEDVADAVDQQARAPPRRALCVRRGPAVIEFGHPPVGTRRAAGETAGPRDQFPSGLISFALPLAREQQQVDHPERVDVRPELRPPGRVADDRERAALHRAVERLGDDAAADAGAAGRR